MTAEALTRWFRRPRAVSLSFTEAYALWADSYPPYPHNALMAAEQAVVAPIIAACAPRVALDVGTGTGRNVPLLTAAGARVALGVDLSAAMLRRHVVPAARIRADACALPFRDARFDFVCSSLMAGDLPELGTWVHEAARVLTAGGHLVYSDFHPDWAAHGWRRTFTAGDGRIREVPYLPHAIEEHLARFEDAGLAVRAIREPRLTQRASPVVVVFHLQKRTGGAASASVRPPLAFALSR